MFRKSLLPLMTAFIITLIGSGCAQKVSQADTSAAQSSLYTPATLIDAVKAGDTALVKKHLAAKLDVNTKDSSGNSLLHLAVAGSNDKMLTLLLNNGADLNVLNDGGFTPLHLAVSNNSQSIIDGLLQASATTDILNAQGYAAIHTATKANNPIVIDMLLKQSPTDLKLKTKVGLTPLLLAIEAGHFKLIKSYLKKKANLNATTSAGLSALQIAMRSNSLQTLDFLIKKGAKLDITTKDAKTLLHLASEAGSVKIVKLLVRKGIKVGLKDKHNMLALDYAVQNAHAPVVAFLLKKYSKFSNTYKFKLLKTAVLAKDIKTLLALHKGGVSLSTIEAKTKDSILHFAVIHEDMEQVINLILKKTELITHVNAKKLTALDIATKTKKASYVAVMKPYYLKVQIRKFITANDFLSLKALVKKYPKVLNLIESKKWKLALNGPEELMIGDLKLLSKKGRSQTILIAQINRLKSAYKSFTSKEIDLLTAYGLSSPLIAAMINKTAELETEQEKTKEKKTLKALQEALLKVEELALQAQQKIAKFQEIMSDQNREMLQKQNQMIQEQIMTRQAIKSGASNGGGSLTDQLTNKIINKALE
jgi:ankyrin repeat protein